MDRDTADQSARRFEGDCHGANDRTSLKVVAKRVADVGPVDDRREDERRDAGGPCRREGLADHVARTGIPAPLRREELALRRELHGRDDEDVVRDADDRRDPQPKGGLGFQRDGVVGRCLEKQNEATSRKCRRDDAENEDHQLLAPPRARRQQRRLLQPRRRRQPAALRRRKRADLARVALRVRRHRGVEARLLRRGADDGEARRALRLALWVARVGGKDV
mmetsp:Transcript_4957/g.15690  ORF Transcript_4957/g.15690 Transcript_4957/m.15690 type:complete len:221 (+) Transcript_4957:729-1391(+)